MKSVFVDGQEGTTGLQIRERLASHGGVRVLEIEPERRKDVERRRELLAQLAEHAQGEHRPARDRGDQPAQLEGRVSQAAELVAEHGLVERVLGRFAGRLG